MTLIDAILNKVNSQDNDSKRNRSPPPDVVEIAKPKKKRPVDKYSHVNAIVDCAPPYYDPNLLLRNLPKWRRHVLETAANNARLVVAIKTAYFNGGKVDCHWRKPLYSSKVYFENRARFLLRTQRANKSMYKRIVEAVPRVQTVAKLHRDWMRNRQEILQKAKNQFVLFPPVPTQTVEDAAFIKPPDVERTRVYLTIGFRGGSDIGELTAELFDETCPATCSLFLELLDGDPSGYGYIGTSFFRKVAGLFWSGGDVVYDNGFGCYAQRGRSYPIGAENYHFPHSMPGLLSMRVTRDDEMCGNFNITFKPLPQFDLRNVVFGRIIRPCKVYEVMRELGNAFSTRPVVELRSARRRVNGRWRHGAGNTKLAASAHR